MDLEEFTFVLVRRGPRAGEYTDEQLERTQAGHLARLTRKGALG